jgi:LysM repeat protein
MKSWKSLVFFLVLNVMVSVCATLTVLYFWDRNRGVLQESLLSLKLLQSPRQASTTATAPAASLPQATPTDAFTTYVVKAGDDFSSIANNFGIDVEELISINGFTKDQPLGEGEVLRVPYKPTPIPEGVIQIKNIIGAGDLETERVLIKYSGDGELVMSGWKLQGQDGNVFTFPEEPRLVLYRDGAVYVFTKPGVNSVIEFFWGRDAPAWRSGDTVSLLDAQGSLRATYQIP